MARKATLAGIAPLMGGQWHGPQFRPQPRTRRGEEATGLGQHARCMLWLEQRQQAQVT